MGLEGRRVSDNMVMFGEPLSDKVLKKLQSRSPTADSIISSLPKSAFIPIQQKVEIVNEESEKEVVAQIDKRKSRLEKKRLKKFKRKNVEKNEDKITIEKIINDSKELEVSESEEKTMDLEKELEALSQQVKPKQEEVEEVIQEETPQADLRDQIMSLLSGEENPPTEEMIDAWKGAYGKSGIHVMAFGEGEVYIYHHLTRGEWKKLKELMARLQESSNADDIEEQLKEKVVMHCILWPSLNPDWLDKCKAGVIDSLYQMILLNSGFLTPQQAMLLTTQL